MFKKSLLLGALALAASFSVAAKDWKEIRVAIDPTYKPFTFKTADGKPTGLDVKMAEALCDKVKAKCVFVEQQWDAMVPGLMAKKYDAIISSMSITEERKKSADFSDSYYDIPSTWIAKAGSYSQVTPASLKGKKIIVTRNTPRAKFVQENYKDSEILLVAKEAEVTMELAAGRGDIGFGSSLAATAAFLKSPEGKAYGRVGSPITLGGAAQGGGVGIAMRKGEDALRNKVNAALKTITANGVYKSINDKYFDVNIRGE